MLFLTNFLEILPVGVVVAGRCRVLDLGLSIFGFFVGPVVVFVVFGSITFSKIVADLLNPKFAESFLFVFRRMMREVARAV